MNHKIRINDEVYLVFLTKEYKDKYIASETNFCKDIMLEVFNTAGALYSEDLQKAREQHYTNYLIQHQGNPYLAGIKEITNE